METKKTKEVKKAKTVPMNKVVEAPVENTGKPVVQQEVKEETPAKYSYEELEGIVKGLVEQNNTLVGRIRQYEELLNIKRLDYLFAVLQNREGFSKEFVSEVISEIEESLTIKTEEPK